MAILATMAALVLTLGLAFTTAAQTAPNDGGTVPGSTVPGGTVPGGTVPGELPETGASRAELAGQRRQSTLVLTLSAGMVLVLVTVAIRRRRLESEETGD